MTWLEFIINNFIPGTATEIAEHIEKAARDNNFGNDNNTIKATVFYHLPKHTEGRIREGSKRKPGKILFKYDSSNNYYYLLGENKKPLKSDLVFSNIRKGLKDIGNGKVVFTRDADQSKGHTKMLDVIEDYILNSDIDSWDIECEGVDAMYDSGDAIELLEIKSYKDGIFKGVGQLKYYKYQLENKFEIKKKINLTVVGNFTLPEKYIGYLKSVSINYKNVSEFKK